MKKFFGSIAILGLLAMAPSAFADEAQDAVANDSASLDAVGDESPDAVAYFFNAETQEVIRVDQAGVVTPVTDPSELQALDQQLASGNQLVQSEDLGLSSTDVADDQHFSSVIGGGIRIGRGGIRGGIRIGPIGGGIRIGRGGIHGGAHAGPIGGGIRIGRGGIHGGAHAGPIGGGAGIGRGGIGGGGHVGRGGIRAGAGIGHGGFWRHGRWHRGHWHHGRGRYAGDWAPLAVM